MGLSPVLFVCSSLGSSNMSAVVVYLFWPVEGSQQVLHWRALKCGHGEEFDGRVPKTLKL